jgi:formiminotetrahydrofolate cyclodeaminase
VSAAAGTLAAALAAMVSRLTIGKKKYAGVQTEMESLLTEAEVLRSKLARLSEDDTKAFDNLMAARKLPKDTEAEIATRNDAINAATREAALVPLEVMRTSFRVIELADICAAKGNVNAASDSGVAAQMAYSAVIGAGLNVRINMAGFPDVTFRDQLLSEAKELQERAASLTERVLRTVHERIDNPETT